eukprot:461350-Pyramimonas_sp.AAC.1
MNELDSTRTGPPRGGLLERFGGRLAVLDACSSVLGASESFVRPLRGLLVASWGPLGRLLGPPGPPGRLLGPS